MLHWKINHLAIAVLGLVVAFSVSTASAEDGTSTQTSSTVTTPDVSAGMGPTAGHDDGGFYLKSGDGNYMMRVFGLMQARWVGTYRDSESGRPSASPDDNSESGFEFRRIELGFTGHIHSPKIGYLLVLATEGGAEGVEQIIAQDVKISYALNDNWSVAIGRYFAPFLREEIIGGGGSLPIALSLMNNVLSVGRAEGLSVMYSGDSLRAHVFLNDGAGSGGGGGVNNPFSDTSNWALTARTDLKVAGDWGQWGDFTASGGDSFAMFIGAAVHYEQDEPGDGGGAATDTDLFAWTADASVESGALHVFASVAGTHSIVPSGGANLDKIGIITQVGYMASKIEPFFRYEVVMYDSDHTRDVMMVPTPFVDDDVHLLTAGMNYHVNSYLKLGVDVMYALDSLPADSNNAGWLADGVEDGQVVSRVQAQLKF